LCSGGLDSILSALVLKQQQIDVTWVSFVTPFFSSKSAERASKMTQIPLIIADITDDYMQMMKAPKAGFGKNMNPCMDCHALMFAKAGELLEKKGFDFLFSGEVVGQRPKSQTKNSLRYVEKHSGFDGRILRPLSAKRLPETRVEKSGLVDREQLLDITGRSRKAQMQLAKQFGIKDYPAPAGGCLLTDIGFSNRLKELMRVQSTVEKRELYYLKNGRHFRLDNQSKVIAGRSKHDNAHLLNHYDPKKDLLIRHARMAGPDVILTGRHTDKNIQTAAMICASYTRAEKDESSLVNITGNDRQQTLSVQTVQAEQFKDIIIQ
jgi:tRNA-specific 2-thiouridylase